MQKTILSALLAMATAVVFAQGGAPKGNGNAPKGNAAQKNDGAPNKGAQGGKQDVGKGAQGGKQDVGKGAQTLKNGKKAMSLAEARGRIGEAVKNPDLITQIMKQLSTADQKQFVAEVNEALSLMPGSNEAKAAMFLNVDKALVRGADSGNIITVITEVFATAPVETLPIINERFAADMFNRAADPEKTYTDEQYMNMCKNVMTVVNDRMVDVESGAERATFVILMLNKATNESIPELVETLVETLPEAVQGKASTEWIPAAQGEKSESGAKDYGPLLGESGKATEVIDTDKGDGKSGESKGQGREGGEPIATPNAQVVMRFAGPQLLESMLGDVVEGTPLVNTSTSVEANTDPIVVNDNDIPVNPDPTPEPEPEPDPYQGQDL